MTSPFQPTEDLQRVFDYLAEMDPLPAQPCDAVLGFGVFDLAVPRLCGALHAAGHARRIILIGGIGAGTADLGQPEADAFLAELQRVYPNIPRERIIVENRSTNTGENVRFAAELLERQHPDLQFGRGIRSVIAVAAPARLRRVRLTLQQLQPAVRVCGRHHAPKLADELALYASKGIDLVAHMLGELDRIEKYAPLGWLRPEPLPPAMVSARAALKQVLATTTTLLTGVLKNHPLSDAEYKQHLRTKYS